MGGMRVERRRCPWCGNDPLYVRYHDEEWGVPLHDDRRLFEMLTLEGAQAGLSWLTILRKREHYRKVFEDFDPARVARFGAHDVERLMGDPGIVRNRMKIESTIANARSVLGVQEEFGSLDAYLWGLGAPDGPVLNRPRTMADIPARPPVSDAMSKALKKRGFGFVGSTICYAFMQAVGMVDDHVVPCWRATRANPKGRTPQAR
jgi:DNA-3-methyladenine glycosylase I